MQEKKAKFFLERTFFIGFVALVASCQIFASAHAT